MPISNRSAADIFKGMSPKDLETFLKAVSPVKNSSQSIALENVVLDIIDPAGTGAPISVARTVRNEELISILVNNGLLEVDANGNPTRVHPDLGTIDQRGPLTDVENTYPIPSNTRFKLSISPTPEQIQEAKNQQENTKTSHSPYDTLIGIATAKISNKRIDDYLREKEEGIKNGTIVSRTVQKRQPDGTLKDEEVLLKQAPRSDQRRVQDAVTNNQQAPTQFIEFNPPPIGLDVVDLSDHGWDNPRVGSDSANLAFATEALEDLNKELQNDPKVSAGVDLPYLIKKGEKVNAIVIKSMGILETLPPSLNQYGENTNLGRLAGRMKGVLGGATLKDFPNKLRQAVSKGKSIIGEGLGVRNFVNYWQILESSILYINAKIDGDIEKQEKYLKEIVNNLGVEGIKVGAIMETAEDIASYTLRSEMTAIQSQLESQFLGNPGAEYQFLNNQNPIIEIEGPDGKKVSKPFREWFRNQSQYRAWVNKSPSAAEDVIRGAIKNSAKSVSKLRSYRIQLWTYIAEYVPALFGFTPESRKSKENEESLRRTARNNGWNETLYVDSGGSIILVDKKSEPYQTPTVGLSSQLLTENHWLDPSTPEGISTITYPTIEVVEYRDPYMDETWSSIIFRFWEKYIATTISTVWGLIFGGAVGAAGVVVGLPAYVVSNIVAGAIILTNGGQYNNLSDNQKKLIDWLMVNGYYVIGQSYEFVQGSIEEAYKNDPMGFSSGTFGLELKILIQEIYKEAIQEIYKEAESNEGVPGKDRSELILPQTGGTIDGSMLGLFTEVEYAKNKYELTNSLLSDLVSLAERYQSTDTSPVPNIPINQIDPNTSFAILNNIESYDTSPFLDDVYDIRSFSPLPGPYDKSCFPRYVKISTPNGDIEISEIMVGDLVFSYDLDGNIEVDEVTQKFVFEEKPILSFVLSDNTIIDSTDSHPFLTNDGTYKTAIEFKVGDSFISYDGMEIEIVEIKTKDPDVVYNITVKNNSTYFANKIRVHNKTAYWFENIAELQNQTNEYFLTDAEWEIIRNSEENEEIWNRISRDWETVPPPPQNDGGVITRPGNTMFRIPRRNPTGPARSTPRRGGEEGTLDSTYAYTNSPVVTNGTNTVPEFLWNPSDRNSG